MEKSQNQSQEQNKTPAKLSKENKARIDELLACENDHKDWEHIYAESNIIIEKKKEEVNCVMPLKLHAILPGISFKHLAEMIIQPEMRQKWDHLQGFDIIEQVSNNEDIIYTYINKTFSMMKARDYLQKRLIVMGYPTEDTLCLYYKSVEHPDCPPKKGFIRADTKLSGFILRDLGRDSCQITIISQTDIKGKVPKAVINYAAATFAPSQVKNFLNFAEKRKLETPDIDLEKYRVAV